GDWSSDVCSSDLETRRIEAARRRSAAPVRRADVAIGRRQQHGGARAARARARRVERAALRADQANHVWRRAAAADPEVEADTKRSEEHTSELQSPYDLVCRLLL